MITSMKSVVAQRPLVFITAIFAAWKGFLLLTALTSPGIGYDTSTSLLERSSPAEHSVPPQSIPLILKLVRWDAIYFISLSHRGHMFEQEWAFGKGLSTLIRTFSHGIFGTLYPSNIVAYTYTGVLLSHISHYLCCILVWQIAKTFLRRQDGREPSNLPILASVLHILSPAGIFLSAPYTESAFAFLNMLGIWLYLHGTNQSLHHSSRAAVSLIGSGIIFGCATMIRNNGLLSGIPLVMDAMFLAWNGLSPNGSSEGRLSNLVLLISTGIAGILIAVGFATPQVLAYLEYCTRDAVRPWCGRGLPLIYEFVQSHYWNVGFLRYWTISNIPLFLLASPCIILLLQSVTGGFKTDFKSNTSTLSARRMNFYRLALPQLTLAILAVTNYHVQIITRLSSAYPWWYIFWAGKIQQAQVGKGIVRYFVLYALIQAVLFASFLPPA